GPALFFHRDARPSRPCSAAHGRAPAAEAADRTEHGGDCTSAAGSAWVEAQGSIRYRLRRRAARFRGGRTQGRRYRLRAHAIADRARQGPQGPLRHAVAAAARTATRLVAGGAAARRAAPPRLAVSRPQSDRATLDPPGQPRRSCRTPSPPG